MFKKLKHLTKEFLVFLVIFSMVCWSVSLPLTHFIKNTKAAGGIELMSVDDGGSTPDVYLDALNTPEAFLKIAIYETEAGTNTLDSVTVQLDQAMDYCSSPPCTISPFVIADLGSLSNTSTSGLSLWLDDGDGNFDSSADTLISSTTATTPSDWTTLADLSPPPDNPSNTLWQTVFSNLNLTIPTSFAGRLTVFVAASAAANLDADPLHKFYSKIPQNGINISTTATSPTIADFPTESYGWMFMPVTLGDEGSSDSGSTPIVISEIQTGGDAVGDEFIELYNRNDTAFTFPAGWTIGYNASTTADLSAWTTLATIAESVEIPAYSYYLIGVGTIGAAADLASTAGLDANGGFVGLITEGGMAIDWVGYGALTTPSLAEGGSPAPAPEANGSIERKAYPSSMPSTMIGGVDSNRGNGSDSNNNSADFIMRLASDNSDPQNSSSETESDMILSTARGIVLNEILYNTVSGVGWIEIYNASTTADIVLTDYVVEIATTTATSTANIYTIPTLTASSESFTLIEWNEAGTNDTDSSDGLATLYAGTTKVDMSAYGGDITLWDDSGAIVDYIQYGGSGKHNEANAVAAGKWASGDFIPISNYNESIARQGTTGDDYDSSMDWMPMSSPSAGYPNTGGDSTAPTAVTNVILSDNDSANYGLDDLDVRVTWSPANSQDSSFDRYELYILPNGTSLDTNQHSAYASLYGQYYYVDGTASTNYIFTGYGDYGMSFDSAGTALDTGSYQAHVVAVDFSGNRSSAVSSPVETLTNEGTNDVAADTVEPMVDHMNIWEARATSDLTLYARMGDDRDQCSIATSSVVWKIGDDAWANATTTACTLPAMIGNVCLRECTISWPASGWNADTVIYYYLAAYDQAGNSAFVGMYPTTTESEAQSSVWVNSTENNSGVDFIATADWDDAEAVADLSGTVIDESGAPLQDAFVVIEGVATAAATTTSSGAFTFADNVTRHPWIDIRVLKSGYMSEMRNFAQNSSGAEIMLFTGDMSMAAGGSTGGNGVAWTAPMDGMMMSPTNIGCTGDCSTVPIAMTDMPIVISFFNQMNSSTIDDTDASNAGSNIYVTSDGNTKIAGSVKYVYNESYNTSEARFYSSTALNNDTFYMVVLTPNVNDVNGNPIESNRSSGNYEFSFSTMADGSTMWDGGYTDFGDGGMYMPPYVIGTNPAPGSYDIPLGAILTVEFSEPMDPTSISTGVTLYPAVSGTTVSLDSATKQIATISHTSALAANTTYEIRVMGSAKSQLGVWIGDPVVCGGVSPDTCLASVTHYTSSFITSASNDETNPTVSGSYPTNNDGITNTSVVDVAVPSMEVGFSEAMNPSTINSQNITLKKGTVSIAGTVNYDAMSNSAKFSPSSALAANSVYTLTVIGDGSSGVADLSSNYLAANSIISFKTGSSDTANPEVLYANGDDYQIAITFSEPMNAAPQTDADNWTYSVLNPANYYINTLGPDTGCSAPGSWSCTESLVAPYNTAAPGNLVYDLGGINISYNAEAQTVELSGFNMCNNLDYAQCSAIVSYFQVFVDNVKDRSNNTITNSGNRAADAGHANASRSPLQNSADTYGILGPMDDMGTIINMDTMGMFGAGAFPMNAMAGQSSMYMIDIPVTKALQDGMKIILTFPTGFNVSSVAIDPYSPMNNDMNDWNGGVVAFDSSYGVGGVASTTTNTITMQLDISTTTSQLNTTAGPDGFIDFLHMDLKGIVNASIPKDFGTSGYTVDVKTKSSDGALLESITTMPFFVTEAGSNTLTVVVTAPDAGDIASTTTVFLGSPMTGPMEAVSTAFVGDIATSTFTNLPNAEFMIFTDPYIDIGGTYYLGKPMPEQVWLSASTTKAITLEKEGSGSVGTVNVYLTGDYTTSGTADDIDIFANSPSSFRVKTLASVGNTNPNTAMYLTEGDWMMGIGPAMPMGAMAGPPPMPDWMSPQMINIVVGIEAVTAAGGTAGVGDQNPITLTVVSLDNFQVGDAISFTGTGSVDNNATTTITAINYATKIITAVPEDNWGAVPVADDVITSIRETSNGDNDSNILFSISTQSLKNIKGYVIDDSGNGIGNAEVYAYQPYGGFGGGHTTTDTSGKFTLKIGMNGVWTIGAFKPGLPNSQEKSVEARDDSAVTGGDADGNDTADILLNGTLISDLNNDNAGANPLQLKLKRPSYTISGKVLNSDGQAVAYAPVWAYQPASWGHADTMTDSSGNYILYVDNGVWRIEADAPGVGWLQYSSDITIDSVSQSDINLRPATGVSFYNISGTVTIDGSAQQFMPLRASLYDANGNYQGRDYGASTDSSGQYTISLPGGATSYYRIDTWTPSYGEIELVYDQVANSPANILVNSATTTADITVATVDLKTISIQFDNGQTSQTGFLHVDEMDFSSGYPRPTGFHYSTDISGLAATTTIKLKANKYYFFDLDVPSAGFFIPTSDSRANSDGYDCIKVAAADRAVYFTLPDANTEMITVSGTVTDGTSSTSDAWVWLGNPSSHFHSGTQSDSGGDFSLTVPVLSSGNYELGADKPGYMSPAPVSVSGTASSTSNTITLTGNTLTISGHVYADADSDSAYDAGEGLPNAWVWAEETSTGQMAHAPADATGAYELGVVAGSWQISAGANGYTQNDYRVNNTKTAITVSGSTSESNKNIALTVDSNWIMSTKTRPITPSSGGTVDDSGSDGTGVKVTIPPNALGSDSSSGNVSIQDTSAVTNTTSAEPLGGLGKIIAATDNAGNAITTLDDYIDIEIVYYKADLNNMSVVDYSKLKNLSLSYWDNSLDNWVSLSTTRKAYYKLLSADTEWTLKADNATTSQTGYEEFIDTLDENHANYYSTGYHDYKLVFTAKSNHLTVFGATNPPDGLSPSSPAGLSQSGGSGTSVDLSWTAVTTNTDASAITDLLGYEVYRSTDGITYTQLNTSDNVPASYTDSSTNSFTIYYYKVTAADDGGNETALADSTALQVCSNSSISNGTITASCAITCDSGYTQSGNSCAAPSSGSSGIVSTTYCSSVEYDEWQDECINGLQYRNILSRSPVGCALTLSQESERTRECGAEAEAIIEEVIAEITETAAEAVGAVQEAAQEFAQKIVVIASEAAEIFKANINSLLAKFGFKRNLAKERVSAQKYVKNLIKNAKNFSKENEYALTNFIAYGTETTFGLGEGERAGVVNSYKSAFENLPITEENWNDVIKIANGRWPGKQSEQAEQRAKINFRAVYLREPDRSNPNDDAAITVMAYGLRPADRNLESEKAAIRIFKDIYGYNPEKATAWDVVRAIAYSGATR